MSQAMDQRRRATREKIVEAARRLFSQLGYHETQVMDIVRAVGMSAGTFYRHFRDKRDLYEQLTSESVENLRRQLKLLREPLDIEDRDDSSQRLRESFLAFFDWVDGNPQQVLMLLRGVAVAGRGGDDAWTYSMLFAKDLAEDADAWLVQGARAVHAPTLFAHAVVGMSLQVLQSYLIDKEFSRDEAVDALLSMTLSMFEACFELEMAEA